MRRILYAALSTVAGLVLLIGVKTYGSTAAHPGTAAKAPGTGSSGAGLSNGNDSAGTSTGAGGSSDTRRTVSGQTVDTPYGPVQVKVTLSGSTILDIDAVRLPDGNQRDVEIAGYAVPQLRQEALAAQSAQIDTVSGATYTSEGYIRSLQSALDRSAN
jgi:uncharacterized protein with FMN-binding domain